MYLLCNYVIIHTNDSGRFSIITAIANSDDVITLLQNETLILSIIGSLILHSEVHDDLSAFTRLYLFSLCEGTQLLICLVQSAVRLGDIRLNDFLSGMCSCVFHFCNDCYGITVYHNFLYGSSEIRVSQTKSEREHRLNAGSIKISVAYIDAFTVSGLLIGTEVILSRIVFISCPGR